jgi:hypothetical protein
VPGHQMSKLAQPAGSVYRTEQRQRAQVEEPRRLLLGLRVAVPVRSVNLNETREIFVTLCQSNMGIPCVAGRMSCGGIAPLLCTFPVDLRIPIVGHHFYPALSCSVAGNRATASLFQCATASLF